MSQSSQHPFEKSLGTEFIPLTLDDILTKDAISNVTGKELDDAFNSGMTLALGGGVSRRITIDDSFEQPSMVAATGTVLKSCRSKPLDIESIKKSWGIY